MRQALLLLIVLLPGAQADLQPALDALSDQLDGAPTGAYPLMVAGLATRRPRAAIAHVSKRLEGKHAARRAADRAVRLLQHVLPADRFAPLLKRCRGHADPWVRLAAADYLLSRKPAEGIEVLEDVGSAGPRFGLQCLILALRQRAAGLPGWRKVQDVGNQQIGATRSKTWKRYRRLLTALLEEDAAALRGFLGDAEATPHQKATVLQTCLVLIGRFDAEGQIGKRLAGFLRTAAVESDAADAFVMATSAARLHGGGWLEARHWDPARLAGPLGLQHVAAFNVIGCGGPLSRKVFGPLCDDLVRRKEYRGVVVAAAAMARHDAALALARAKGLADPGWRREALRVVYRCWAEVAPAAALKLEGAPKGLRMDLRLSAAVGAARSDPALALKALEELPAHADRFSLGACRIGASLRPEQAAALLVRSGKLGSRSGAALAWSLLPAPARRALAGRRPFFAERYYPVDRWPGPRRPSPARFQGK